MHRLRCFGIFLQFLPFAKILFSGFFFLVFCDFDLKIHIWICLHLIQVKFDFCQVWPTFSRVIALCKNLVFRTFLSRLLWHRLEIYNTDQVGLLLRLTYFEMSYYPLLQFQFYCLSRYWLGIPHIWFFLTCMRVWPYCPLENFSFLDFYLLSFVILTWHLAY